MDMKSVTAAIPVELASPAPSPNSWKHKCSSTLLSEDRVWKRVLRLPSPRRARSSPSTFFTCTASSPLFSSRSVAHATHSCGTEKPGTVHTALWCACLAVNRGHCSSATCLSIFGSCCMTSLHTRVYGKKGVGLRPKRSENETTLSLRHTVAKNNLSPHKSYSLPLLEHSKLRSRGSSEASLSDEWQDAIPAKTGRSHHVPLTSQAQ